MSQFSNYDVIDRMNALRKQSNRLGCGVLLLWFLPIPFVLAPVILLREEGRMLTIVLFFAYMIFVVVGVRLMGARQKKKLDELKRLYKETFMNGVLEEFFEDVNYQWRVGITQQKFFDTGLFRKYKLSGYHSEDYLSGTYKGVPFKQADVEAERTEDDREITIFSGRLFEFDYSFKQVQSVRVVPLYEIDSPKPFQIERHMDVVKMENMEFNKIFAVVSADPHEAFYVLTPQVMERLIAIYNRMSRPISVHFKQDKLYVAIDHMDSFDSDFLHEVDYATEKERIRKHIQVIIDVIEMLKLINA